MPDLSQIEAALTDEMLSQIEDDALVAANETPGCFDISAYYGTWRRRLLEVIRVSGSLG